MRAGGELAVSERNEHPDAADLMNKDEKMESSLEAEWKSKCEERIGACDDVLRNESWKRSGAAVLIRLSTSLSIVRRPGLSHSHLTRSIVPLSATERP